MGSCCASRTDTNGIEKGTKGGAKDGKAATGKNEAVKFNPMDQVRNTVTQVLKDSK